MNQEQLEKMIGRMINVIKPKGVSHIVFDLDPMSIHDNEFYMNITYIVPDNSEYLGSHSMSGSDFYRKGWNHQIKNTIKDYFDTRVSIVSSGIRSETYHERSKQY